MDFNMEEKYYVPTIEELIDNDNCHTQLLLDASSIENGLSGIYCIKNIINNKLYIGSSSNLRKRHNTHKTKLKCNKHANRHLQNAVNLYDIRNFKFIVLEICDYEMIVSREQFWINELESYTKGYNQRPIAESNKGFTFVMPENAKEKLRSIGKERGLSLEFKKFMSDLHKGKYVSDETKKKSSISHTGYKVKEESKKLISKKLSIPILNIDSGEIYENTKDCAKKLNISTATVFNWLSGQHRAKVNLVRSLKNY